MVFGLVGLTGLYSLAPIFVIFVYYLIRDRRGFFRLFAGFCLSFVLANLIFIILFGKKFILPVYIYHLLKPKVEGNNLSVFLEIIKNKRMYYGKLNPIEVNKARSLEQGLSVLLKEVLQVQNSTVGGINTKFILVLNEPGLYENFDGLSDLIQQVARSLAHLDSMRRRVSTKAGTAGARQAVPLLEKEVLDRISGFGFVSGTDGRGGHIISFSLAVFLQRIQES